ncbi:MAG: trk system potassium uptake protein TrkH [Chloroflexi bacterium]|jgi:trk system potassium uptake protein TrkH|nr:MAG: trk system potassium uptake protein TrkH [Chloroflexota bacterium]
MDTRFNKRLGDIFITKPRRSEIAPITFNVNERRINARTFSSPLILVGVFLALILVGAFLLSAPFAHHEQGWGDPILSIFTATSAVTVTGLIVVDTATYWTSNGQVIILLLMFVGGLGFMTLAAFLLAVLGQRVSMAQRLLIRESLGSENMGGIQRLSVTIVAAAISIQVIGFLALFARFLFSESPGEAAWQALFHSVSGFNNAGFVILNHSDGLHAFREDFVVLSIIGWLIILGSLSFWVVVDLVSKDSIRKFSLVSKIVLSTTIVLIITGTLFFLFAESNNPKTIGDLPLSAQIGVSIFEGVSGRTAGFSTIDYGYARPATDVFMSLLMFIGGATGSVAGGIKVTTFFIIVLSIVAIIRERAHVTAFGREISPVTVRRSYAVTLICLAFIFLCTLCLALTNSHVLIRDLAFESVSAFGTVGLSTGATGELNGLGHMIVAITMFIGRVGPIIVGLRMVPNREASPYRYATEPVTIG